MHWSSRRRHGSANLASQGGEPGIEVLSLRQQLEAAQTQIALLKNVVIQALRAQSAAEEALRREQATPQTALAPEGARDPAGAPEPMLGDQLEALTGTVERLQAEVDALHGRAPHEQVAQDAGAAMDEFAFPRLLPRRPWPLPPRKKTRCCRSRAWAASTSP